MAERILVRDRGTLRWAACDWVRPPGSAEATALEQWRAQGDALAENDAAELGHMAAAKWRGTAEWGTIASSLADLQSAVREDSTIEVTGMLMASADWFPGRSLGVCLFHRTWMNNLFLDFLAAHPATQRPESEITGVGIGLVFRLAEIACALDVNYLWGETTAFSGPYYRRLFQQDNASDRLLVSNTELQKFCADYRGKLSQLPIP